MQKRLDVWEIEARNSRVDGHRWSQERFRFLDFRRAYLDGPSLFGALYLHVPDMQEPGEGVWRRVSPLDPKIRQACWESGYWFWSE